LLYVGHLDKSYIAYWRNLVKNEKDLWNLHRYENADLSCELKM